jgi:hypothetical protein
MTEKNTIDEGTRLLLHQMTPVHDTLDMSQGLPVV